MKLTLFILSATLIILAGCSKKFDELKVNPNSPENVPASLALNGVEVSINQRPWGSEHRWNQFALVNYNYYGNNEQLVGRRFVLYYIKKCSEDGRRSN